MIDFFKILPNFSLFPDKASFFIFIISILFLIYGLLVLRKYPQMQKRIIISASLIFLGAFFRQIPFLSVAYYPRSIMPSFYFLEYSSDLLAAFISVSFLSLFNLSAIFLACLGITMPLSYMSFVIPRCKSDMTR